MGDAITATVMVVMLAFLFLAGVYTVMQLTSTGNSTIDTYTNLSYGAMTGMDSLAPFFVIAIIVGLIFSAMMINSNPIFFVGMLLVSIAFVVISIGISNAWYGSISGSSLQSAAALMPNFSAMMIYLPVIAIVISIIFAIALFMKGGQGGG